MALPRLNDTPKYELVIPSTQKSALYRPFLVKEQKVLMMASESQDKKAILRAITDTINACVEDIDVTSLTTYDVDYIFTMIRTKSVGETSELNISCAECAHDNAVKVNLDNIEVKGEIRSNVVPLTDTINITMKHPSYEYLMNNTIKDDASTTEIMMNLIATCLDTVQDDEEMTKISDEPIEEVKAFIDALTTEQFTKITDYLEGIPTIELDISFDCEECNHHNERKLKGLEDFF
jgi:hypothetical protein